MYYYFQYLLQNSRRVAMLAIATLTPYFSLRLFSLLWFCVEAEAGGRRAERTHDISL